MSDAPNGNGKPQDAARWYWRGAVALGLGVIGFFLSRLVTQNDAATTTLNDLARQVSGFMAESRVNDRDHSRRIDRLEERVFAFPSSNRQQP